jgi:serine/threonine protein kinase
MSIKKIGKYSVLGQLGTGAHSTILQISRQEDGRPYALKIVNVDSAEEKKFLDQAEHEFRVAQMLDHPNLIKVYALEPQTDWLFRVKKVMLLIEYVPGRTLDKMPAASIKRLVPIFVEVAAGLVHMHRRGVFHADLKPGNILVNGRTNQAKVIDYGLAHIKGEDKGGRLQGTPEYMAPETVTGRFVNEKTDMFNFGATMYRAVTCQFPPSVMPSGGTARIGAKSYADALKPVGDFNPSAPKALCDIIHHCLRFNPENRPERMSEVQGQLDKLADDLGPPDDDE